MGNDETLLAPWQYVYSENLDIYRDPRYIQLSVKPVNYKTGLQDLVVLIGSAFWFTDPDTTPRNIYFAFENKDIYDAEWTLRYEWSVTDPLNPRWIWRSFIFGIPSTNGIAFLDYQWGRFIPYFVDEPAATPEWYRDDSAYSPDWTPYALDMQSNSLVFNWITKPVYNIGSSIFTADNIDHRNLLITSPTGWMSWSGAFWPWYPTIASYWQWISQPWEVVFASVHSDSVWSGSTTTSRTYTELSALSVVPNVSDSWTKQAQIDKYSKILHWVNKNNTDILIAWDVQEYTYNHGVSSPSDAIYSSVYVYKHYWFGADAQQLIVRSRYSNNIEIAFWNHWITYYLVGVYWLTDYNWAKINDMVYCISNKDDVGLIYAYWKTFGGINDAWSVIISKNSFGKKMKRVWCLWRTASKNWFYYSYEDEDWVFGIDYYDDISIATPTSFQPSGKIFLRKDDGGDMSIKKEVKILTAWVYVPEDTTIKISYILDDSWVEKEYQTITHTTQWSEDYKTYKGNEPVKWFKTISWFAELTSTGTKSPYIANFNYELAAIQN